MRLLRCECGVRRPGDEAACPGCGGVGGDEVVVRMANGRAGGWPAPVAEVTALRPARPAASRCGMCATPMAPAAPGSDLQTCEVCDVAVATAC
ncbi:MAG TPA: hypothetical protein VFP61_11170 [Acidimicrobiales bacterium]|nr:hypothetical protein [Acidimicrobiales bacterium]